MVVVLLRGLWHSWRTIQLQTLVLLAHPVQLAPQPQTLVLLVHPVQLALQLLDSPTLGLQELGLALNDVVELQEVLHGSV